MERVIIVFGAENKFEGTTKDRFKKAIGIPAEVIIFSGRNEAELMNNAYQNNYPFGYEYDKILVENQSTNTRENLKFSFDLMKANGYNPTDLIFVSSWYHLPRIFLIYYLITKTHFNKSQVKVKVRLVPVWNWSVDILFEPIKIFIDLLDVFGLERFHRFLTKIKYKFYNRKSRD